MTNAEKVYQIVASIPKGKVLRYGDIAVMSGILNPRVIGNILHRNQDPVGIPCHRVVNTSGRLAPAYAFGGQDIQRQKLVAEGVIFKSHLVDLQQSLWRPELSV